MFGFSIGELLLVLLIAVGVLGPKEMVEIVKSIKQSFLDIEEKSKSYLKYLDKETKHEFEEEIVNYITDMEGNLQRTYDLSKLFPDIKDQTEDKDEKTS